MTASSFTGSAANTFDKVRLTFNEAITARSFTAADVLSLRRPDGTSIGVTGVTPVTGTDNQFDVTFAAQTMAGAYSITVGPDILDRAAVPNPMDQNENLVNGEVPSDRYSGTGSIAPSRQKFYATGLPAPIRDMQTTTFTITVPPDSPLGGAAVTDLNFGITLNHTFVSDLVITVTSPGGKTVTVFSRRGGSGDNLTNTVFDDEAATPINKGKAPFTGSFRPEQLLSAFDGVSAVGTWTVRVSDTSQMDTGSVLSAYIDVATGAGVSGMSFGGNGSADGPTLVAPQSVVPTPRTPAPAVAPEAPTASDARPADRPAVAVTPAGSIAPGNLGFDLIQFDPMNLRLVRRG